MNAPTKIEQQSQTDEAARSEKEDRRFAEAQAELTSKTEVAPKWWDIRTQSVAGKIRVGVGYVSAVFIALILTVSGSVWYSTQQSEGAVEIGQTAHSIAEASLDIGEARAAAATFAQNGNEANIVTIREALQSSLVHSAEAKEHLAFLFPERIGTIADLEVAVRAVEVEAALPANQSNNAAWQAVMDRLETTYQHSEELRIDSRREGLSLIQDTLSRMTWLTMMFIALLIACVVSVFAVVRYLVSDLADGIRDVTAGLKKVAAGETGLEIVGTERNDEIGEMARSLDIFHRAAFRMEQMRKDQHKHEAEKAEAKKRREQELANLANRFEQTVGEVVSGVASASSQLKTTAGSMAAAADQSSNQSSLVAKYMGEASTGVTAAAAASDEFAMSIGEISRQAASSAELARKASDSAQEADSTISNLTVSAEEVGNIVELIQSIARRTNLLALNASIEAARGGEAGRGFAVVASEVKELAAQTSRATEEVAKKIQKIQNTTGSSVDALRSIGEQIEQLEATAISIASAVDQQSVAGQDLARSIDLAARSTDEVSGNVSDVRESSLATGAAASQVLGSATELENQSATLHDQVDQFLRHVREERAA